jgi:hypothetical protein
VLAYRCEMAGTKALGCWKEDRMEVVGRTASREARATPLPHRQYPQWRENWHQWPSAYLLNIVRAV